MMKSILRNAQGFVEKTKPFSAEVVGDDGRLSLFKVYKELIKTNEHINIYRIGFYSAILYDHNNYCLKKPFLAVFREKEKEPCLFVITHDHWVAYDAACPYYICILEGEDEMIIRSSYKWKELENQFLPRALKIVADHFGIKENFEELFDLVNIEEDQDDQKMFEFYLKRIPDCIYKIGSYRAYFYRRRTSENAYILVIFKPENNEPYFYFTTEQSFLAKEMKEDWKLYHLYLYIGKEPEFLGVSEEWRCKEKFLEKAFSIVAERLEISDAPEEIPKV